MMGASVVPDGEVPGELLGGRYRPIAVVGRGAIAEVIRARDEQTGRQVALKVLHGHLRENAVVVERFRREVEIVRRVAHQHVLPIHEVVEAGGLLFLVMDYHPGGDLADRLARRRCLPPDQLVDLAGQLCGALAAAHRAGIVHRDVKPSNVLCGDGERLDVRLCDFGLARMTEGSGLTVANAVLGTPEYMAPEVIADGQADPRSDIYSLGVVLFEAATGRLPFYADSPYQLMRQHLDVEPSRAQSLVKELPPEVDQAIARALAKDPLDRFATAEDLAAAIANTRALAPVAAPPRTRAACATCGGWLVQAAAVCADCGARTLRLDWQRRGVAVLVTGPGHLGDRLDAVNHLRLSKALDEVSGHPSVRKRPTAPRFPFYVARGLTPDSAQALDQRLRAIGLWTEVVRPGLFGPQKMRRKAWLLFGRSVAVAGGLQLVANILPRLGGAALGTGVAILVGSGVAVAARSNRPLVRRERRPSLGPGLNELTRTLPRLSARQDRRLVARIVERLGELGRAGSEALVAPLAARAALATRGLATVDEKRAIGLPEGGAPAPALAELRRDEQARMVFRADLLRAASRLDGAALILARSEAAGAAPRLQELAAEVERFSDETSAEEELRDWLRDRA
jgi:tRNA A-37 threonylcarbamoyl transferase component Bud32